MIFKLYDLEFEWDEEKYTVNLRKHKVKFEEAAEFFSMIYANLATLQSKQKQESLLSDFLSVSTFYIRFLLNAASD